MTTPSPRQPKGIPVGGQFAATAHAEPGIALDTEAEHQAALAEMGAAARTGIGHSSAVHIAELLKKSPDAVYDENAATLAAANACTYEDIHGINQVFNHGHRPLQVAPGAKGALAERLTAGGLTGKLAPYEGSNPDAGESPLTYISDTGRELVVSESEDEGFKVMYDDRYDEDTFSIELDPDVATPELCADTVRDALWQLAVNDANSESPTPLHSGDFYELRDITVEKTDVGATGELITCNDDDMWTTVSHDYQTGATAVYRDGAILAGPAADIELAAVFEGLHSEPANGDFHSHARTVFGNLLAKAAEDPDAPTWAASRGGQPNR